MDWNDSLLKLLTEGEIDSIIAPNNFSMPPNDNAHLADSTVGKDLSPLSPSFLSPRKRVRNTHWRKGRSVRQMGGDLQRMSLTDTPCKLQSMDGSSFFQGVEISPSEGEAGAVTEAQGNGSCNGNVDTKGPSTAEPDSNTNTNPNPETPRSSDSDKLKEKPSVIIDTSMTYDYGHLP